MELILASSSRYRRDVLEDAGFVVEQVAPDVDERALDDWLDRHGPEALALELAGRKLESVVSSGGFRPGVPVVAADQVGVLDTAAGAVLLGKRSTPEAAAAQLRLLSGTTHRLVNGLAVQLGDHRVTGVDVQVVTFRKLADDEILEYVWTAAPFDTAGSYRLEDDAGRARPFVTSVVGEDPSGVLGLPLPLLRRLLAEVASR